MPEEDYVMNILPALILVLIMFCVLFLPIRRWIRRTLHLTYKSDQEIYQEAALDFITDYDKENPVSKKDGELRLINLKIERGDED
jgi:hypothetical protein